MPISKTPPRDGLLLGLDIGTTRIKAVALDSSGTEQAAASAPTPFRASADGIDMTVPDFERALAAVLTGVGSASERVVAIGVAGLAESGAPFLSGRPVGPIIAWHDGRGAETVASLESRFGPALSRWTGRQVRTVSSLAKLGWLLDHGLPAPDRWLGVPELALFILTGSEATEHSLAARTGAYHVTDHCFLPEVIAHVVSGDAAAGGLFPTVRAAGSAMGLVAETPAHRYGLPAGIPVTVAGHDHLAAAAGLRARRDDLLNSVGTAETLLRRLDAAPDVERVLELDLVTTVWPGGEAWGVLASATRSGLVIGALTAHLGLDPNRLDALAAEGAAEPRTDTAGSMVGLGQGIEVPDGRPAAMWTATLWALARRTAAVAERIGTLTGPPSRLVVFGGGSRSAPWLAAKAAASDVPVMRSTAVEAAARGAAVAAGSAAGWWPPGAGPAPALEPVAPGRATMRPV